MHDWMHVALDNEKAIPEILSFTHWYWSKFHISWRWSVIKTKPQSLARKSWVRQATAPHRSQSWLQLPVQVLHGESKILLETAIKLRSLICSTTMYRYLSAIQGFLVYSPILPLIRSARLSKFCVLSNYTFRFFAVISGDGRSNAPSAYPFLQSDIRLWPHCCCCASALCTHAHNPSLAGEQFHQEEWVLCKINNTQAHLSLFLVSQNVALTAAAWVCLRPSNIFTKGHCPCYWLIWRTDLMTSLLT